MAKNQLIRVPVNNHFATFQPYDNDYSNELSSQILLKKINSSCFSSLYLKKDNTNKLEHINILSFRNTDFDNEQKLVYDVLKIGESYYIKTGLYVGYLYINGIKLEINTGYKNIFLKRMLNVANNIFFDNSEKNSGIEGDSDSFLSLILEYLFLTSFKNAFALGLPSVWQKQEEISFNIKGKVNLKKYISSNIISPGKISFFFKNRVFDQDIIDVLYLAFNSIGKENIGKIIKNGNRYHKELKSLYSGHMITNNKLEKICKKSSLNNPMFSKYKIVLKYAKYILKNKNILLNDDTGIKGISGFVLDVSELWEVYLANLIKNRFADFNVTSQVKLDLYNGTFFARQNSPDIIMESNDKLIVIDAKFKKMRFRNQDVDRADLHQINSYTGYYTITNKDKLCLSCLIYPSENNYEGDNNICNLYGLPEANSKLSIEYIKIGDSFENILLNENEFINRFNELIL